MLLIKVTLPPLDKYNFSNLLIFFPASPELDSKLSCPWNFAPKGRPKYFIGRNPCLQPRTATKNQSYELPPQAPIQTYPSLSSDPT